MNENILPAGSPAVFRFGVFTFDCGSRRLFRDGEPRHLSPKAQQLLHLLLVARPRVLSRDELYDALWPATFVSETNLAGVVNELRRVLGDEARRPRYVRTVHTFGYAFSGEAVATSSPTAVRTAMLLCNGKNYDLHDGDNVVGRALGTGIMLTDLVISRRHAVITIAGGGISVKDLGSKNGTYVDGKKLGSSPVVVDSRSHIQFGTLTVSIVSCNPPSTRRLHRIATQSVDVAS